MLHALHRPALALAVCSTLCATAARADAPKPLLPEHSWVLQSTTGIIWNPIGAETRLRLGYRYRLSASPSILLRNSYVKAEALGWINPAYGRLGVAVTVKPLAILKIEARYLFRGYFGAFNQFQSFQSPNDEYDDDTRSARRDAGLTRAAVGHEVSLSVTLQGKVGPVALVNQLDTFYYNMPRRQDGELFFQTSIDMLLPKNGFALRESVQLVYITPWSLIAGVWYSMVHAFYRDSLYQPGESRENRNSPNHKIGPVFTYTFDSSKKLFQKPTIVATVQWWVKNRYRTGLTVNGAIPTGLIAFRFTGDF